MQSASQPSEQGSSLWLDAWIKLRKNRLALFGLAVLMFLCALSLLTPWIAPYSYEEQDLMLGATPPSAAHWLGTDIFGRDMLTRIMYGGRVSLMVGFIATAVALVIGILWGSIAGFFGGRVDAVMIRAGRAGGCRQQTEAAPPFHRRRPLRRLQEPSRSIATRRYRHRAQSARRTRPMPARSVTARAAGSNASGSTATPSNLRWST